MGCGLGGCYSCVMPVRGPDGGEQFVKSCVAGPVMAAESTIQYEGAESPKAAKK